MLFNHLWPTRIAGGYIGVDVFFVISGYLITAHLLREQSRSGRMSLPRFYARRARRLLPAALLVGLVSLAGTMLFMPVERWERVGRELFAAAAYFENWLLAASAVDYSAQNEAATPAQHYWSLSVEEQFYLLWPLTLLALAWLLTRRAPRAGHRGTAGQTSGAGSRSGSHPVQPAPVRSLAARPGVVAAVLSVLAAASFIFAVWYTGAERSAAYFNTFTRVWEFLLGALVAVAGPALARWNTRAGAAAWALTLRGIVQLACYAAIAWAALAFNTSTPFPGPWALVPVAATAVIIAVGPSTPRWSPARLLHWRPVQYTGDLSYSLYLWHWPLIVFAPFALSRELRAIDRVLIVVVSFGLAALTKHLVEDPGRTRLFAGARPRRSLLAALISVAVMGALVLGMGATARAVQADQAAKLEALAASPCWGAGALGIGDGSGGSGSTATGDGAEAVDCGDPFGPATVPPQGEHNAPWSTVPPECTLAPSERQILAAGNASVVECDFSPAGADTDASLNVWLVGDSHAEHWKAPVFDIARANGWRVTTTMQGGCPTLQLPLTAFRGDPTTPQKQADCLSWSAEMSDRVLADQADLVLISNFAAAEAVDDGSGRPQAEQLAAAFPDRIGRWTDAGADVVVIRDSPTADAELGPDCVLLSGNVTRGCVVPATDVLPVDPMFDAVLLAGDSRVHGVDLTDHFCVAEVCSGVIGGVPVYFDADHIARTYAATLAPALSARIGAALGATLSMPGAS